MGVILTYLLIGMILQVCQEDSHDFLTRLSTPLKIQNMDT